MKKTLLTAALILGAISAHGAELEYLKANPIKETNISPAYCSELSVKGWSRLKGFDPRRGFNEEVFLKISLRNFEFGIAMEKDNLLLECNLISRDVIVYNMSDVMEVSIKNEQIYNQNQLKKLEAIDNALSGL